MAQAAKTPRSKPRHAAARVAAVVTAAIRIPTMAARAAAAPLPSGLCRCVPTPPTPPIPVARDSKPR